MSYDENGGNAGSNGNSGTVRFPSLTVSVRGIRNTERIRFRGRREGRSALHWQRPKII
jgi:hypothetical protein